MATRTQHTHHARSCVRLSQILRERGRDATLVAFGRPEPREGRDLARDVAALAAAVDKAGRGRWLVHCEDAYAASVTVLALLHADSYAVLAPNAGRGTLAGLASGTRGAIVDSDAPLPHTARRLAPLSLAPAGELVASSPAPVAPLAEFHTSGTTGGSRGVPRAVHHVDDEIATLEALFGAALPSGTRLFSTVSPQHIYGLLFRVLWPLAAGRPFQRETLLHTRELVPRMGESESCALVTTPAHLQRMTAGEGLAPLRGLCRAIFTSGAPLDPETALAVRQQLGTAPREILGSTETGGVAWRRQDEPGAAWTPFPNVDVERDAEGRLVVRSPQVCVGAGTRDGRRRFAMGDLVELLPDGRFALGGRADRTVKIAGVRLSLPDMERELTHHSCVQEAALVVGTRGPGDRVQAALVPSPSGRRVLRESGRRGLASLLSEHLAGCFDRVLLPRAWRVLSALPHNAQGKLPADSLRALFEGPVRDPVLLDERTEATAVERWLEVPPELACLEGHFERAPVVPGVVLIGWALDAARLLLPDQGGVRAMEAVKFPTPVGPGQRLRLRVESADGGARLRFRATDGARVFATGRLQLRQSPGT